jgi:integrase
VDFWRGQWRARVRGELVGLFATEDDAWRAVGAWLARDDENGPQTTRSWFEGWLDEREKGGDIRGVDKERSVYRQHIASAKFADVVLRRVRPIDIQAHLTLLSKKPAVSAITFGRGDAKQKKLRETDRTLSRQTVTHVRRILRDGFGAAVLAGKLTSNPVTEQVKVPKMARVLEDEDAWSWLTVDEIEALMQALPTLRLRAFFAAAIYVGLRDGELLGLRWQDLHMDAEVPNLDVRKSYDGPTKTKGSRRTVPLLAPVLDALKAYRKTITIGKVGQLVFPADDGGCYSKGYDADWTDHPSATGTRDGWRSKAKVRPHVRFHDLRHTCASHLVQGSWGLKLTLHQAMQWMGHSDIKTTLRYAHLAPDGLLGVAGLWNESRTRVLIKD